MFWLSSGVAFAVAVFCAFILPRSCSSSEAKNVDWTGGLLFAPAVTLVLLALHNIGQLAFSGRPERNDVRPRSSVVPGLGLV